MITLRGTTTTPPITEPGTRLYEWVPQEEMPRAHVALIRHELDKHSRRLGLPRLQLRFFRPYAGGTDLFSKTHSSGVGGGMAGFMNGFVHWRFELTVAIDAGLHGRELVRAVVAHEARHCKQFWGGLDIPKDQQEQDADRYAARYMENR